MRCSSRGRLPASSMEQQRILQSVARWLPSWGWTAGALILGWRAAPLRRDIALPRPAIVALLSMAAGCMLVMAVTAFLITPLGDVPPVRKYAQRRVPGRFV